MRKPPEKIGVGQLVLQIVFPTGETSHGTGETEISRRDRGADRDDANGLGVSGRSPAVRSETERQETGRPTGKGRSGRSKWYSLIDKVYALPNLRAAWAKVKANGGKPGIDRLTIEQFGEDAEARLAQLAEDLRQKTYRPKPVRRVYIEKSGGGQRPLGIPTVRDRIVQQALLQVLGPIFEAKFSARSHGFRPERGCATALAVVDRAVRHGYDWVVDADLQSFFDTVDHPKLITALNEEIADGSVLNLIQRILTAGVVEPSAAEVEPTELGTPQGGPLSPLLANIYLHAFDVRMVQAGYGLVRYADDFILFAKNEGEAEAALALARQVLEGELGLRLHPEKTRVVTAASGFEFLGFHYYRDPQTQEWRKEVRRKSVQRFRDAIRARTPRLKNQRLPKARHLTPVRLAKNQRLEEMVRELNGFLRGWHWYFKSVWSPYPTPFLRFDQFVRRRLRAAISGRRGQGWWNVRLPNALLHNLGLASLDELQWEYQASQGRTLTRKGRPGGEPYAGKPHVRFGKAGGQVTPP
jgi:RNA-directed DNA polymerase